MLIALITIGGSILLSILGSFLYVRQAKIDLTKEYQKRFNEKKWDTYTAFTDTLIKIIGIETSEPNKSLYHPDVKLEPFMAQLLLVGSDPVIAAYRSWRVLANVNGPRDVDTMKALFDVVVEMRRDLGNPETQVDLDVLLGMIVPNYQRAL